MNLIKSTLIAVSLLVTAGCAATGPANDGFELSQESADIGKFFGDELLSLEVDASEAVDKIKR